MHSSTQSSPFDTCFGYLSEDPLDMVFGRNEYSSEPNDEEREQKFIQRIQMIHQVVKEKLEKTQAQYKA